MISNSEKIPDWLLERLVAGELPESQAKALRLRLSEQGEEQRLAALSASNSQVLAAYPVERVVPEIKRRIHLKKRGARREPSSRRIFLTLSLATACAGAFAFFALREPSEYTGIKGDPKPPELRIYRKTDHVPEKLNPGAIVRDGDALQIRYLAHGKTYGVIASVDGRGKVTFHLPEDQIQAASLVSDGERVLPHSYELDDSPGFERFVFVTSDKPFDAKVVAQFLSKQSSLPAPLKMVEFTLKKESR